MPKPVSPLSSRAMGQKIEMGPGLTVAFRNAGHILGSSILELWVGPRDKPHKVIFSGDIGQKNQLIVQDPETIREADTLFIESTYGNRNHKTFEQSRGELLEAVRYSHEHREKVLIPAFAVELPRKYFTFSVNSFERASSPPCPYTWTAPWPSLQRRSSVAGATFTTTRPWPSCTMDRTPFNSRNLSSRRRRKIHGHQSTRVRHRHRRQRDVHRRTDQTSPETQPVAERLFRGHRRLSGGRNRWKKARGQGGFHKDFGERILVRAKVFTIGGFSAHADQQDLLDWISHFENPSLRVCAVHGEENISEGFAALVRRRFGFPTHVPAIGEVIRLPDTSGSSSGEDRGIKVGTHLDEAGAKKRQEI